MVNLINQPYFCFIKMFMINLIVGLSERINFTIDKAILIKKKVIVSFSKLSL